MPNSQSNPTDKPTSPPELPPSPALAELIAFIHSLPEPRVIMDGSYHILAANPAYCREFEAPDGQALTGKRCFEISHRIQVPCDQAGESCPLAHSRRQGIPYRMLHQHHTRRGEEHVEVEITPVLFENGQPRYFVETLHIVRQASVQPAAQGLVGRSPAFVDMLEKVMRVAPADATVLLLGETGTGKELVAHAIHEASARAEGPFVAVDCAGLTETLFESELFGYEKGAFTGAAHRKAGLVEAAAAGTLFLDEIGELPLSLQVKLLRLLETGTYRRVGGLETLRANFRLVSATHRHLPAMVAREQFRRDLYFRINTFPIQTPALHERPEDIPLLAQSLLERVDRRAGRHFTPQALDWLSRRRYSGNIRELRNIIERATLMSDGESLDAPDLERVIDPGHQVLLDQHQDDPLAFHQSRLVPLPDLERAYLEWALARVQGDMGRLAASLGISRRTLYRKLQSQEPGPEGTTAD